MRGHELILQQEQQAADRMGVHHADLLPQLVDEDQCGWVLSPVLFCSQQPTATAACDDMMIIDNRRT